MTLLPIVQAFEENQLQEVVLLATDLDGTLTKKGKFTVRLMQNLTALAQANISVLIVTGRSAGWVNAIANYLPIIGAIAENGGLFYNCQENYHKLLTPIVNLQQHRQNLAEIFTLLQSKFPQLQESEDNCFRWTDWTFDVAELTHLELEEIEAICRDRGWGFTYSTIQCHIKPLQQDKAIGLQQVLKQYFPAVTSSQVVTVGDSPNDESLFNFQIFPVSVGVANILDYCDRLKHQPTYVTEKSEVEGFCELAELLIRNSRFSKIREL